MSQKARKPKIKGVLRSHERKSKVRCVLLIFLGVLLWTYAKRQSEVIRQDAVSHKL